MSDLGAFSLIVPVHNEERRLPKLLAKIDVKRFGEAIFVLDGCTDRSALLVPKGARKMALKKRSGKGAAIRAGFLSAKKEFVCIIDADGTFSKSQVLGICWFARKRKGLVLAERASFPKKRGFKRAVLGILSKVLFGIKEKDTQCGLLAAERRPFLGIFRGLKSNGYEFPIELVFRAKKEKIPVSVYRVSVPEEDYSDSTFNEFLDPPKMLLALLRLRLFG